VSDEESAAAGRRLQEDVTGKVEREVDKELRALRREA
jgi:hypothetical protein